MCHGNKYNKSSFVIENFIFYGYLVFLANFIFFLAISIFWLFYFLANISYIYFWLYSTSIQIHHNHKTTRKNVNLPLCYRLILFCYQWNFVTSHIFTIYTHTNIHTPIFILHNLFFALFLYHIQSNLMLIQTFYTVNTHIVCNKVNCFPNLDSFHW